jgi:hypothetical protein
MPLYFARMLGRSQEVKSLQDVMREASYQSLRGFSKYVYNKSERGTI